MLDAARELRKLFGDAVRCRRQNLGMSQRAMARKNGLSQRLLSAVETGTNNCTISTMVKLAAAVESDVPGMLTAKSID